MSALRGVDQSPVLAAPRAVNQRFFSSIVPFVIGNTRFTDSRLVTEDVRQHALRVGARALTEEMARIRRPVAPCDASQCERDKIVAAYHAARELDPSTSWKDFRARFVPVNEDWEQNPTDHSITFVVSTSGRVDGTVTLYNVRIHREGRLSAMLAPMISQADQQSYQRIAGLLLVWFLNNDLVGQDGRVWRVARWRFPIEHPQHRWPFDSLMREMMTQNGVEVQTTVADGESVLTLAEKARRARPTDHPRR